jgi:hypothetical protein
MDTVTNVVGVLMIVLIMVSLNIANTVNKILSELPPVTIQMLEQLKMKIVDNTPKQDPTKVEEETKKLDQDLQKIVEELKTLDLSAEKQDVKFMDLDELRNKIDEAKKKRDVTKAQTDELLVQIDKLKALLDTTPVYAPPPATVVRMPNPRAMPENAVQHLFLVAGNRVHFLNDQAFIKLAVDELQKVEKTLQHSTSTPTKPVFDHQKSADHLINRRIATRELKLTPDVVATTSRLRVKLEPLPEGGETAEQIKNPASNYQRLLRKLKAEPQNVIGFLVYKDSIETYLEAREVADGIGVPTTWKINTTPYLVSNLPGIVVNPLKASPTAPPAPPLTIPPPKASID